MLTPEVKRLDVSEIPILFINLSGDLSLPKIKEYAEDLQDRIETMKEIKNVPMTKTFNFQPIWISSWRIF